MVEIVRLALTGKMRAGKSQAATHLYVNHSGFHIVSFGDKLKRAADDLLGDSPLYKTKDITRPCPFGGEEVLVKRKPRRLYQDFGQAVRELDPDVWIRHAAASVEVYENYRDTRGIVIDDLRQPNEYEWARANGFIIIRVQAGDDLRLKRVEQVGDSFSEEDLAHDTEQHVDKFDVDYTIVNDGDMNELERQVDEIMVDIKAKGGRKKYG